MKKIFLTSAVSFVAHDIPRWLEKSASKYNLIFIPTAAEVEEGDLWWLRDDRKALVDAGFNVFEFTLTNKKPDEVKDVLNKADIICVGGGNTFYLLEKIKESGFDKLVKEEVLKKGKPYIGCSAGSWVAGPNIELSKTLDYFKFAPNLKNYDAINLVDFVIMPHWGSEDFKDSYMKEKLIAAYNEKYKLILLNNFQYVRVVGDMYEIINVKK